MLALPKRVSSFRDVGRPVVGDGSRRTPLWRMLARGGATDTCLEVSLSPSEEERALGEIVISDSDWERLADDPLTAML